MGVSIVILKIKDEEIILDDSSFFHSSYLNHKRLPVSAEEHKAKALLGDSLLRLIHDLYFYTETSITLNQLSSNYNSKALCDRINKEYKIEKLIKFSIGEESTEPLIEFNCFIIIFDMYQKYGFDFTYNFIRDLYAQSPPLIEYDYKSLLQEYVQTKKGTVNYYLDREEGKDHQKIFYVSVKALGKVVTGKGVSKKQAEKDAAKSYYFLYRLNSIKSQQAPKKLNFLRTNTKWRVDDIRVNQLKTIYNCFNINENALPFYYMDACLTHSSYKNNNSNYKDGLDSLTGLGSRLLIFIIDYYLFINFETICNNLSSNLISKRGVVTEKTFFLECIKEFSIDRWMDCLLCVPNTDKTNTSLKKDVFKAVLGGLLLSHFYDSNHSVDKVILQILNILEGFQIKQKPIISYNQWLETINNKLGFEVHSENLKESGPAHNRIFTADFSIIDPVNENKKRYSKTVKGKSIKSLRKEFSKDTYNYYFSLLHLNSIKILLPNNEDSNLILREFLKIALESNKFSENSLNVLGGLCFNDWNMENAKNILYNLYNRMLFKEIKLIYDKWTVIHKDINIEKFILQQTNLSDVANILIDNKEKSLPTPYIKIEEKDNSKELKTETLIKNSYKQAQTHIHYIPFLKAKEFYLKEENKVTIFTRFYEFKTNNCPFCSNSLNESTNIVNFKINNKIINIELDFISSCVTCGIKGFSTDLISKANQHGYTIGLYEGSPSYYASTILNKNKALVLKNTLSRKIKKGITPKELEKKMEINKKIGEKGEELVFHSEVNFLKHIGENKLSQKVEWVAKTNCSLGYDILSFNSDGSYKYIEVKSTSGYNAPFFLTSNELETAKQLEDSFFIYRVENIYSSPRISKIQNPVAYINEGKIKMKPSQFILKIENDHSVYDDEL
jgi:dsRNA-specific ribonuclease